MNDQLKPSHPTHHASSTEPYRYDDLHALTGAYAVDAVDDLERARFEHHLETCDDCRDEVASLQAAASELSHLADLMPPPQLRDRVLKDIAAVRPLPPAVPVRSAPTVEVLTRAEVRAEATPLEQRRARREQRRGAPRWLSVAAAVILVGGGATAAITQPWSSGNRGLQVVASKVLDDPAATHHTSKFFGGASAEVVTSATQGRAVIVTKNMPAAPGGKDYQLWFQRGGAFYSAGLMSDQADQVTVLDGNANGASAVGITEEPDGGSPQPTTAPLALISLA